MNLEAKNLGVVTGDAPLDVAVDQILLGSTSYNGQVPPFQYDPSSTLTPSPKSGALSICSAAPRSS